MKISVEREMFPKFSNFLIKVRRVAPCPRSFLTIETRRDS